MSKEKPKLTVFEYGAVSSKYSVKAENKLTAYVAMVLHYSSQAHLIMLYEPKEIVKDDVWTDFTGQISKRLDEIFGGENGFDIYCEGHIKEIRAAYKSIKRLV